MKADSLPSELPKKSKNTGMGSLPSPGDLPDTGIKPGPPALQADSLPFEPPGKADKYYTYDLSTVWNNGTTIISV